MTITDTTDTTSPADITSPELSEARIGEFAESLFNNSLATVELTTVFIGRRLGLYAALRRAPCTTADLARIAGIDGRYAQEWLEQQASSGTLVVDDATASPATRRFSLPEEHAVVLLDEEHPAYSGALADFLGPIARTVEDVIDAFRTGAGVPFAAYGLHHMQAGFTRPQFAGSLVSEWLPALPDIQVRLESGEALRIADFGCGEGWAGIYIAEAYPNVTVDGFDLDDASVAEARKHAADRGVGERVRFEIRCQNELQIHETNHVVLAGQAECCRSIT